MNERAAETIADARWFPLRYDWHSQSFAFAWIPPEMHRALTFISDLKFTAEQLRTLSDGDVRGVPMSSAPLHIILHSGLGGSTLLARALAQPGVVTTLKEPMILTDVVAAKLRSEDDKGDLLGRTVSLLSRPFAAGESLVCKMSSVGNGLASAIAQQRPSTQIICLQTPLEQFLASLASKGAAGRAGARRLFTGLQNARMTCFTLNDAESREYSDLKLAGLAWLSIQKMIQDAGQGLGPKRVRSIGSDQLLGDPKASLAAIAEHLGIPLDVEARLASGVFTRHAKTGEPYDSRRRAAVFRETLNAQGAEIREIVDWARKVSDAIGIAWDLPYPLVG